MYNIFLFIGITFGCLVVYFVLFYFIKKRARKNERILPKLLNRHIYFAGMFLFLSISLNISIQYFNDYLTAKAFRFLAHFVRIILIISIAHFIIQIFSVIRELAFHRYKIHCPEHIKFRKVQTQFLLIQRVLNSLIIMVAVIAILMTFPTIKNFGTTILASAGVIGIIIGFAAQKSLGTFFAGLQIALSQPIRIGDVVVVEGQFGTIGEINLTFVIVHTWDGRRLIVPINFFLEKTFETWTRESPQIIGKVKIRADYTLPVEQLRDQFNIWLDSHPLWDRRKSGILVTDADDKTIQIRATMSAKNSNDAWDLECFIREKMITFIQQNHPGSLPKTRLTSGDAN